MFDITIDFREAKLVECCEKLKEKYPNITIGTDNLHLGDIKINHNDILIERKTWSDLEASIKDGRYEEQSHRLKTAKEEGFSIYYFLEGDLSRHRGALSYTTLISTIYSLTNKGFFVIQTKSVEDSALYLLQFTDKIIRDEAKTKNSTYESSSINKKKNSHITRDNISIYMLAQIPNISVGTAQEILSKYDGHISNLIHALEENPDALNGITQTTKDGKSRKMNKNVIENIKKYLGSIKEQASTKEQES